MTRDEERAIEWDCQKVWRQCYHCSAPGSLDTSLSHAAGLIEIAACHA